MRNKFIGKHPNPIIFQTKFKNFVLKISFKKKKKTKQNTKNKKLLVNSNKNYPKLVSKINNNNNNNQSRPKRMIKHRKSMYFNIVDRASLREQKEAIV